MTDRFDAMHAFVAVCDAHGFAPAARRLGVAPSIVTRLVAGLEGRLGVRLLQRTTRTVRLTEPGARFLEHARRILAEVDEAEASAQDERAEPRGRLVLTAPLLFGRMHVAPVVSRFLDRYRGATAELTLSDGFSNLVEEGIDLAIRIGDLADSNLVARRLGQTRRLLVASPAYLAEHPPIGAPPELAGHRAIGLRNAALRTWSFRGAAAVEVDAHLVTNSAEAAIDHALAGGGIASALCYQVERAVRDGRLVEVLPAFAPLPVPIQAVFPTARLLSAKVRAFLDIAAEAAAGWQFIELSPPSRQAASSPA